CIMVLKCAELREERSSWRPLLLSLLYTLVTAALYPVLYTRFDLAPGALVVAALYCLHRRYTKLSGVLLGIAGAVKLWPFALVPIWLYAAFRQDRWRRFVVSGASIGAGAILAALPVLPRAGWDVLSFLKYHAARGIQIETTWSTIS